MNVKVYKSQLAVEIAADLLKIGAIRLSPTEPFTWTSGWKSPVYCDNRLSLSFPNLRSKIKTVLCLAALNEFKEINAIAGVATAGIPQGTLVADELTLPFVYVRSESKGHGLKNRIEGKIEKGQKVLLIEDLVSTGGSSLSAAEALREAGAKVIGIVAVFTYGLEAVEKNFKEKNVNLVALSDYHHLLNYARNKGMFDDKILKTLKAWEEDPESWKG